AAALFTRNLIVAAPITVGRASLARSKGKVRAVLVNSGNANCATGPRGIKACKDVCLATAKLLSLSREQVFPSSTGIIGVQLPTDKIFNALPTLMNAREASLDKLHCFAGAILTTDSRAKLASISLRSGAAVVTGIAKGAGMIHPQLATMLVYLVT